MDADSSIYDEVFIDDDRLCDESDKIDDYEAYKNEPNVGSCLKRTTHFSNYKANLDAIQESREATHVLDESDNEESDSIVDLNDSRDIKDFQSDEDEKRDEINKSKDSTCNRYEKSFEGAFLNQQSNLVSEQKEMENVERQRGIYCLSFCS